MPASGKRMTKSFNDKIIERGGVKRKGRERRKERDEKID